MKPRYRTWIPASAKPRVRARHPGGSPARVDYFVAGNSVGHRYLFETGEPEFETPIADGRAHGMKYTWHEPGVLHSAEPYRRGLQHGTARQWDSGGTLIGTYTLVRGTGWDLWRQSAYRKGGLPALSEASHWRDGKPDGFEWWINGDQRSVRVELHWVAGQFHGIHREWNGVHRLARGYPKYYVRGNQVDKRTYVRAAKADPTLPPFRDADNRPRRAFPPEVAAGLRQPRRVSKT